MKFIQLVTKAKETILVNITNINYLLEIDGDHSEICVGQNIIIVEGSVDAIQDDIQLLTEEGI